MSEEYGYIITEQTFQQLYSEHWEKMYSYCLHHCQDEYTAEEIVQDVFLSLWDRRTELIIRQEPQKYLIRSAKLKLFDYYRHCAVIKKHIEESGNSIARSSNNIQESISHKEAKNSLNDLLKQVPEQSAIIYRMSRENDFTIKEIANSLGITEKKVEYYLYKTSNFIRQGMLPFRNN
jgi:RNA polymerase sigma-70 factor (family 1)